MPTTTIRSRSCASILRSITSRNSPKTTRTNCCGTSPWAEAAQTSGACGTTGRRTTSNPRRQSGLRMDFRSDHGVQRTSATHSGLSLKGQRHEFVPRSGNMLIIHPSKVLMKLDRLNEMGGMIHSSHLQLSKCHLFIGGTDPLLPHFGHVILI